MEIIAYLRIAVLLLSTILFSLLINKLIHTSIKGFGMIWLGLGLVILNLIVGALFHSHILPDAWKENETLLTFGFITGYVGQTTGLILIPFGIYNIVRVLIPKLKESQSLYEQFVHSIDGIIYEVDVRDFRFTFISKRCQDVLGYSPERWLRELTWEKIIHPDDLDKVLSSCTKAIQEKRNHTVEFRALSSDGRVVWLRDIASVIVEQGQSVKVRGVLLDITERINAEHTLQENEELLRTIIDAEPQCVKLLSPEGNVLKMNPAGLAMVEADNEDAVRGKSVYPLIIAEHRNSFRRLIEKTFEGEGGSLEFEIIGLKGTRRRTETHVMPLRNANSKIVAALGITRDITVEKNAQEALDLKTAYFEQLFRKSPAGIVMLDNEDRIVDVNESFQRMFQYPLEEIKGRPINELIVPEKLQHESVGLSKHTQRGKTINKETFRKRKDGSLFPVHITGYPIIVNGQQVGIYGLYFDISERKNAEDVLRTSEERYRSLIDSARDIIFTLSPEGFITSLNPAFENETGWTQGEWIGRSFTDLIHPDDLSKVVDMISATLCEKTLEIQEYRIRTKSNDYIIGEFTTTCQQQDGRVVGLLGIARDVTSRKQLEDHLRQTQKMESIGTLATGIAHDFNNILGIILAHSAMLERSQSNTAFLSKSVTAINKAVERGASLVRQILTLARKRELPPEHLVINNAITELVGMLNETFPKTIEIVQNLCTNIPPINIDSTKFTQILLNLSVNARDAMSESGTLTFTTSIVDGNELRDSFSDANKRQYVHLSIIDTGTGMDEHVRQRIFEPFFTTKEHGNGTGMGLAVVYGIVQNYGGFINVESEIGRGTTFHFYFPAVSPENEIIIEAKEEITQLSKRTGTILLVEDEELLNKLLKDILENFGFTVYSSQDGHEAATMYKNHHETIDLVISDLGLPKLNGVDLIKKLQEINPQIKIIVTSGYLAPSSRNELLQRGVREFIEKPYIPTEVIRTIDKFFNNHSLVSTYQKIVMAK